MPLLSVLWGFALLSLIAVSLLSMSGNSRSVAHNALEAVRTEAIAEAALVRTVIGLSDLQAGHRWVADGRPEHFEFDGLHATITIQDELGRIDLNYADRGLLFGLLHSAGMDVELANKVVDAILDRRTSGDPQADAAAEVREHGLFQSVDELRLIPGMSADAFRRVAPALTVYSQHQAIDPELAPPEALLALPGITPERVGELLRSRAARQQSDQGADGMPPVLKGRAFAVRIRLDGRGSARKYEATIRFTDDPGDSYWLLDWRDQTTAGTSK